eukprot:1476388-Amphidinium_carterae.1
MHFLTKALPWVPPCPQDKRLCIRCWTRLAMLCKQAETRFTIRSDRVWWTPPDAPQMRVQRTFTDCNLRVDSGTEVKRACGKADAA